MGEFKKILAYADQYQKKTSTAISLLSLSVVRRLAKDGSVLPRG